MWPGPCAFSWKRANAGERSETCGRMAVSLGSGGCTLKQVAGETRARVASVCSQSGVSPIDRSPIGQAVAGLKAWISCRPFHSRAAALRVRSAAAALHTHPCTCGKMPTICPSPFNLPRTEFVDSPLYMSGLQLRSSSMGLPSLVFGLDPPAHAHTPAYAAAGGFCLAWR